MATLKELIKDTTPARAIEVWRVFFQKPVTRKNGKKDKLILIQERENLVHVLFESMRDAGFKGEDIKPYLIRIMGYCSPKNPRGYEKLGFIKNTAKDISESFEAIFGIQIDFLDLIEQATDRGLKSMYIEPEFKIKEPAFEEDDTFKIEDLDSSGQDSSIPMPYKPRGEKVEFTDNKVFSVEDL